MEFHNFGFNEVIIAAIGLITAIIGYIRGKKSGDN